MGFPFRCNCTAAGVMVVVALGCTSARALTQISVVSDPGDLVGRGQTFSLTPVDGTISADAYTGGAGVRVLFNGPGPPPKTPWDFVFVAMEGTSLVPGNYPSARQSLSPLAKRPSLQISGFGGGCDTITGTFSIYEVAFDSGGNVTSFAADAEQHCDDAVPALRVQIRVNSNVPLPLHAPQAIPDVPQEVYERTLVKLDGTQSYDPDGRIVTWLWSQIAGPVVNIESPSTPITLFRAPNVSPGGADLRFSLDVGDDAGNHGVGTVDVHVFDSHDRRNLLLARSPPGDYVGGGVSTTLTADDGDFFLRNAGALSAEVSFIGDVCNEWALYFQSPRGEPLAPGTYLVPFPGFSFLAVSACHRGCGSTISGQFTVLEIDDTAAPSRFGARFVQSCLGTMPAMRGTILFDAIAPGNPIARVAGPQFAAPLATVTLDGSGSSSVGSALIAYKWRQLAGPAITIGDPSSSAITFAMPSTSPALVRVELEVDDEDGLVDVTQIDVSSPITVVVQPVPIVDRALALILALALIFAGFVSIRGMRA